MVLAKGMANRRCREERRKINVQWERKRQQEVKHGVGRVGVEIDSGKAMLWDDEQVVEAKGAGRGQTAQRTVLGRC